MERTLEIQWMVNGYGGYTVHRWSIILPSTTVMLYALSAVVWLWAIWSLYKVGHGG